MTKLTDTSCDDIPEESEDEEQSIQSFSLGKIVALSTLCALIIALILYLLFDSENSSIPWGLVIGLIVITSISLVISFWTYYIRSIYIKDGPALVPEKWGAIIGELIKSSKISHAQFQKALEKVQNSSEEQSKKSNNLLESFLTLQNALNTKDEEISRLKKGYDAKIFKRFLMRFIRVDRSLREMSQESESEKESKNYKYLSRIMQDALDECGVNKFTPEIDSDYRDAGPQIADDPIVLPTDDELQDFKIASVKSVGYVLEGEGDVEVIIPSKVSIFRFDSNSEGDE